jgi:hypothetical protein
MRVQPQTRDIGSRPTASTYPGNEGARFSLRRAAARVHRRPTGRAATNDLIRIAELDCVVCGGAIERVLARLGAVSCSHCR